VGIYFKVATKASWLKMIKGRFMATEPDPAIPQQKSILKDTDPAQFLKRASRGLQCDWERIKNSPRIGESDKLNRDILLYWLWQQGNYTNSQIGKLFHLTHSSVSRRVAIIRKKMAQERKFEKQIKAFKSLIKP
jgi:hypothetical protein